MDDPRGLKAAMQQKRAYLNSLRPLLILIGLAAALSGCREATTYTYQGYAEGEFIQVAAPSGGQLESLHVSEGDQVQQGELLFALDTEKHQARVREAEKALARSRAELEDLRKGRRPTEIEALEARLSQAQAALALSRKEYRRRLDLAKTEAISADQVDQAETALEKDKHEVRRLQAELATARLGARQDRIEAAKAGIEAARAALKQVRWELEERSQKSPAAGLVFETFFEPGEWVSPGRPVVSILPPGNMKVVFFVPEPVYGTLSLGDRVLVTWDGGGRLKAKISFISPKPEYTPPVIYSSTSRAKLVFLFEARPLKDQAAQKLHPGQPVDIRVLGPESGNG